LHARTLAAPVGSVGDDGGVRLWLDDVREPPNRTWTWVKTVPEAIELLGTREVKEASLDHDLGDGEEEGRVLCLWMAEHDLWPSEAIAIHSANPVGVDYMCGIITRYGPFVREGSRARFSRPR
jgi:Cyclic-phosphate processing Receiver domain